MSYNVQEGEDFMLRSICLILIINVILIPVFADIPFLKSLLEDSSIVYQDGQSWVPTDYNSQKNALGLESKTFATAKNLEEAVQFWISIYTDYQSQQGVLHDLDNLSIIYEKVDFNFINTNSTLSEKQKNKAREKYIDERKKQILSSINKVLTQPPVEELNDLENQIIKMWEPKGGLKALKEAASLDQIRFQLGQSDRMKEAIYLSGRYLPMMERIFKKEELPLQLTRLVFVESSFNVLARSKVGASGLWQIMPSAARRRLRMNNTIDLRNHPEKATELAAKMLKFNYEMLGEWPLAVTGYNHGPYGVKRLVEHNKTKDLGELIATGEGRRFGFASRNFYASFLAVLEVEGKAGVYFPGIKQANEFIVEPLKLRKPIYFKELVEFFGGDKEKAQLYNPHLQRLAYLNKVPLDTKSYLVIPSELKVNPLYVVKNDNIKESSDEINKIDLSSQSNESQKFSKKSKKKKITNHKLLASASVDEDGKSDIKKYKVTRGDTLYGISKQFGVSIKSIKAINEMKRSRIRVGQILILPD